MPKQSLVYRFHSLREWTWLALKNLSRAGDLLFSCSCQMLFSCLWQSNRKLPPHASKCIQEHPLCSSMYWKQSQGVIGESRGPELGDPDAISFQASMRLSLACLASFSLVGLSPWNALATASTSSHHPDTERAYFKIFHWYFSGGGRACLDMVRPFLGTKDCTGGLGVCEGMMHLEATGTVELLQAWGIPSPGFGARRGGAGSQCSFLSAGSRAQVLWLSSLSGWTA